MKINKIFFYLGIFFSLISFIIFFNSFTNKVGTGSGLCGDYRKYSFKELDEYYEKLPSSLKKKESFFIEQCTK